jgi:hypothetical protein
MDVYDAARFPPLLLTPFFCLLSEQHNKELKTITLRKVYHRPLIIVIGRGGDRVVFE